MTSLNIELPPALEQWIGSRVAEGRYADAADYVRDLLRRDQQAADDGTHRMREMIEEGLASGVIDAEPEAVIEQIIAERHARRA